MALMETEMQIIIQKLLQYYTLTEIGAKISKSEATISRWKNGSRKGHKLFVRELRNLLAEKE